MWRYRLSARIFRILIFLAAVLIPVLAAAVTNDDYTIGPGDTLNINVYENQDLTRTVQVDGEGNISFPLIGQVRAAGMNVVDLSQSITRKLAAGYLINPQVTVVVTEYRSSKATILGKVSRPALYELRGRTSLLELISTAGGLAPDAGQYAYVTRVEAVTKKAGGKAIEGGCQETIRIDLKKLVEEGDTSQNIIISDGDSIFISKMEKIYVTGEVKSAGSYSYEEGLTVIQAVTRAGGFTDRASANGIRIVRKGNGEEHELRKVKMDDPIQPEDVIVVPESFF
jgi:polysaccharide biosynthesis/export protein